FCQITLPLAGSTLATTSFACCRVNTKIFPPTRIGDEWPSPTVIFQTGFRRSGQDAGADCVARAPSRFGPRHCGQSSAEASGAIQIKLSTAKPDSFPNIVMDHARTLVRRLPHRVTREGIRTRMLVQTEKKPVSLQTEQLRTHCALQFQFLLVRQLSVVAVIRRGQGYLVARSEIQGGDCF